MAEKPRRVVPVRSLLTTGLDIAGAVALTAAGWFLLGAAGALAVIGSACLALSFSLSRRA